MNKNKQYNKRILLGVTGSIAAYKSAELVRRLQDHNFDVSVVMTKEAQKFITPLTLSALSGNKVFTDLFEDEDAWEMKHIELTKQTDIFLIAPATANVIAKIAHGLADDLLTCLALTIRTKIVIAPAMNDDMYRNDFVQSNIAKLKKSGIIFIEPIEGKLACGVFGEGHLAEIDEIIKSVENCCV